MILYDPDGLPWSVSDCGWRFMAVLSVTTQPYAYYGFGGSPEQAVANGYAGIGEGWM